MRSSRHIAQRSIVRLTAIAMLSVSSVGCGSALESRLCGPSYQGGTLTDDQVAEIVAGSWLSESVTYLPRPADGPAYDRIKLVAEKVSPTADNPIVFLHGVGLLNIQYLGYEPNKADWEPRGDTSPGWIRREGPDKFSIWFGPSGSALRYDLTIRQDELTLSGADMLAKFRRTW